MLWNHYMSHTYLKIIAIFLPQFLKFWDKKRKPPMGSFWDYFSFSCYSTNDVCIYPQETAWRFDACMYHEYIKTTHHTFLTC